MIFFKNTLVTLYKYILIIFSSSLIYKKSTLSIIVQSLRD